MSQQLKVKVILGSTREGRLSEVPGEWIAALAAKRPDIAVEVLDLREYPMPFFDAAQTPSAKKAPYPHPVVAQWTAKIAEADAFIIVAPEYNHGYPAVLKNALDWVYQEWNNKPVGFVAYGSALGARSVEQLRAVAVELQMAPIRNALHLPAEVTSVLRGGESAEESLKPLEEKAQGLLDQLVWWAQALKAARS